MALAELMQKIGGLAHELAINYAALEKEVAQTKADVAKLDALKRDVAILEDRRNALSSETQELETRKQAITRDLAAVKAKLT